MHARLRNTTDDKIGGISRILLGFAFFMAGILKVFVPTLGQAYSRQLTAAVIPLHNIVLIAFPIIETVLGGLLITGLRARRSEQCHKLLQN